MRYTTIIDITELPSVYRNTNVRLVYIHLALKAGYHDNDRDLALVSIRRLAIGVGLSISATRHALQVLEASGLISRQAGGWLVKKWILEEAISKRPKSTAAARARAATEEQQAAQRAREQQQEQEARQRQELARHGKTQFMLYYEELQRKAAEGDLEAVELVKRHAKTYQQHAAANATETKKTST